MDVVLSLALAYFIGSIPFAYLISRLEHIDIRKAGDRNVGVLNVFRNGGVVAGIVTMLADIGKGALAVVVAQRLCGDGLIVVIAGAAAVAGHNWPLFLRFRGGRGIAVTIGVLLILLPREIAITLVLSGAVLIITRNTIAFGMMLFVPLPLLCWLFGEPVLLTFSIMALPCLTGLASALATHHLPPQGKKETRMFWIGPKASRHRKVPTQHE